MDERVGQLEREVAELARAVAARDTFIAVAGHELRNPMTSILGQLEVLLSAVRRAGDVPAEIEHRATRVQKSVRHYVKRATILLDVSRLTNGKLQLEVESFDLSQVLHEVVDEFAEMVQRLDIALSLTVPDNLPVSWDRLALEQIVDNLISNAIKYGARSPIEVVASADDDEVRIEVRDRGPGIPASDRDRIFGRFERAVGTGERRSGFGVGLWIVGQLVEAMAGTIAVDDVAGGGTAFRLVLPRYGDRSAS